MQQRIIAVSSLLLLASACGGQADVASENIESIDEAITLAGPHVIRQGTWTGGALCNYGEILIGIERSTSKAVCAPTGGSWGKTDPGCYYTNNFTCPTATTSAAGYKPSSGQLFCCPGGPAQGNMPTENYVWEVISQSGNWEMNVCPNRNGSVEETNGSQRHIPPEAGFSWPSGSQQRAIIYWDPSHAHPKCAY